MSTLSSFNPSQIFIQRAVWGATDGQGHSRAKDIAAKLQSILQQGNPVVTFNDQTFTDVYGGVTKGFAVVASVAGTLYSWAGSEGQSVDFSILPINGQGKDALLSSALACAFNPGVNSLFSSCAFTLTNTDVLPFPPPNVPTQSQWISMDFYVSTSKDPGQPASGLIKIGDMPLAVNLPAGAQMYVNPVALGQSYNLGRQLLANPKMIPNGSYYLYVQARTSQGGVNPGIGAFSSATFAYKGII